MNKLDDFSLLVDKEAAFHSEKYVEGLFSHWSIDEIYLGNILTSVSSLIQLLSGYPSGGREISITAQRNDEMLTFVFTGVGIFVLKLFLKEHLLRDVQDSSSKAVFLIQKIADEITVEEEKLILRFNTATLRDVHHGDQKRRHTTSYLRTL